MSEIVHLRPDGIFTFDMDSDVRDALVELHEQGAADGLTDEEIAASVIAYLRAMYAMRLH